MRDRLALAVAAHRALSDPHVLRVRDADLDAGHASFEIDPIADGDEVLARVSQHGPIPFEAAIGFVEAYGTALARAHATQHPATGAPCCLGAVGWAAFVFDARGRFGLLGLGAPIALETQPPSPGAFVAPEVGAGVAASPGADVLGFAMLHRSALGLVALPEQLAGALFSFPSASDLQLAAWLASANRRLFVGRAERRPSAEEMLDLLRRTWARLGARPDRARWEALVASALGGPRSATLRVAPDASWFAVDDAAPTSLARRAPLRRVLLALVENARTTPTRALPVGALFLAGWPGERIRADSSAGRVYVALSTLRRLGLADVIERFEDGYRLAPGVSLR